MRTSSLVIERGTPHRPPGTGQGQLFWTSYCMSNPSNRTNAAEQQGLPDTIARVVQAARNKKAADVVVLDLRPLSSFTDFFVICSGRNSRQVQAIGDAIEDALRQEQIRPSHVEGFERAEWVLLDYFDFIVHIFSAERREFYSLERLWGSAERVALPEEPAPKRPGAAEGTS
jgi:ribosome-associated protein